MAKNNKGRSIGWIVALCILTTLSIICFIGVSMMFSGFIKNYIELKNGTAENELGQGLGQGFIALFFILGLIVELPISLISFVLSCIPKNINKIVKILFVVVNGLIVVSSIVMFVVIKNLPAA